MRTTVLRRTLAGGAVLLAVAAATPAAAQNVIDQQQPTSLGAFGSLDRWSAQTFTPTATNVSGVGAFLQASAGTVTLALWSGNPFLPASQQLASQTVSFSSQWADAFWSPVAVTPGQTYWLLIGGGLSSVYTAYGPTGSYANGIAYYNYSADIRGHDYVDVGGYDLTFRTYTSVGVTVTPEPGTWALLGTGLLAMGGVAARRRSAPSA